ncbi:MAG: hypothetical protein Q7T59_05330 [Candidatus Woesebacteria bacterium]|nr:hypothetical protein [Candidatus Woesebacteria bacterium]
MYKEQGVGKYKEIIFDSETPEGIQKISNIKIENPNSIIVFATGCMDVAQPGHPIFTEQLRLVGKDVALEKGKLLTDTIIIVVMGIGRDSTLKTLKKEDRPINPEMNRAYLVASYKDVDYVILNNREIGEGKVDFGKVLKLLNPDVFVINSDDSAIDIKAKLCSNLGINFKKVERTVPDFLNPTSSTEIINKIKGLS